MLLDKEEVMKDVLEINKVIEDMRLLKRNYDRFVLETNETYLLALEPYIGHLGGLGKRKLLPSLLTRKYFLRLYGYLVCESHFDRLLRILKNQIYG